MIIPSFKQINFRCFWALADMRVCVCVCVYVIIVIFLVKEKEEKGQLMLDHMSSILVAHHIQKRVYPSSLSGCYLMEWINSGPLKVPALLHVTNRIVSPIIPYK